MRLLTAFISILIPVSAYGLTPSDVVELLKKNSPDIKIARERIEKTELERKAAEREFFPRLNLSASFSEIYPDLQNRWNQNYSLGATVSAEPVNFQRFVKLKMDRLQNSIEKERFKETLLEQLYLALKELYTLKAYRERIEFKEKVLSSAEEILKVAQEKYRKGLVMITDVLKARAEVEKVKGELSTLKARYRQSFNRLNELLDFTLKGNEKPEVRLVEELPSLKTEKLVETALKLRPEVRRAREEVRESSLKVEYTKRNLWPSLSITASWSRSGTTFWPGEKNYSGGFTLNFPLFDSGVTSYRALSQEKERRIALLNLQKLKNEVKREVLDSVADVKSNYDNLKSDRAFLRFSQKAYDRALNEYRLGVADIVALLQAYENLKGAQDRYVSSLLSYNLSLLSLKKATGELLVEVER